MSVVSEVDEGVRNRSKFQRNLLLATVLGPALSLAAAPLLASALGVEGRGTVAAVVSAFFFVRYLSTFGGQEAALGAALWPDLGEGGACRAVVRWIMPISVLATLVTWFAAPAIFPLDEEAASIYRWVALLIPFAAASDGLRFALTAGGRSAPVAVHIVAPHIVKFVGALTMFFAAVNSAAVGSWVSLGGVGIGLVAVVASSIPISRGIEIEAAVEKRFRRFATELGPGQVARLGNRRLDQLLLGALAGRAELGIYAVAVALAEIADLFTRSIRQMALRSAQDPDAPSLEEYFRAGLVLFIPALAGLCLAIPIALNLLFPAEFSSALWPALILLAAGLANYVRDVLGAFLVRKESARTESAFQLFTLVVAVVGVALLSGPLGAVGAALAALISYSVGAVLVLSQYRRSYPGASLRKLVPAASDVGSARRLVASR